MAYSQPLFIASPDDYSILVPTEGFNSTTNEVCFTVTKIDDTIVEDTETVVLSIMLILKESGESEELAVLTPLNVTIYLYDNDGEVFYNTWCLYLTGSCCVCIECSKIH